MPFQPPPSHAQSALQGWVERFGRWELHWGNRCAAIVQADAAGAAVTLDCRKMWQLKLVRAASVNQGKRYAERWCAARLLPGMPLREAVARLTEQGEAAPEPRRTRVQIQQKRRLREATKIIPGML